MPENYFINNLITAVPQVSGTGLNESSRLALGSSVVAGIATPTMAGTVAQGIALSLSSDGDRIALAKNMATTKPAYAVLIAGDVTAELSAMTPGNAILLAGTVSSVGTVSATAVTVAVATNFSGTYSAIAQIGAGVAATSSANLGMAPAIDEALINNLGNGNDTGIIAISSSITALTAIPIAGIESIATQSATALATGSDSVGLAGAIAASITSNNTNHIETAADLELVAEKIASGTSNNAGVLISNAPQIVAAILTSNTAGGTLAPSQGTFAAAIANSSTALKTEAPGIANAVAQLWNSTTDNANWVTDQAQVAGAVANLVTTQGTNVATTVFNTTINGLNTIGNYSSLNYQRQAAAYANAAANYATAITSTSLTPILTGSAAYMAGANASATTMYQVAQIFGQALAASNSSTSATSAYIGGASAGTGADTLGTITVTGKIIDAQAGNIATGIGNQLEVSATTNALKEQFAAVGLALTNWIPTTDTTDISKVVLQLATIDKFAAPDLLGIVLSDAQARGITMTSPIATGWVKTLITNLDAITGVNSTAISTVVGELFNPTTHAFSTSTDPYILNHNGEAINITYGTITGNETPINNL